MIPESVRQEIDHWIAKYPPERKRSALLIALRLVQQDNGGWLTVEGMDAVADYLNLPKMAVYEVATFYSLYQLKPRGRHKIAVCNNLPCMLRGSGQMIEHLEHRLGIRAGQTTADGSITLCETECLAACVGAPMLQLDDQQYHENLTIEQIDALLAELQKGGDHHAE